MLAVMHAWHIVVITCQTRTFAVMVGTLWGKFALECITWMSCRRTTVAVKPLCMFLAVGLLCWSHVVHCYPALRRVELQR